MASDTFRDIDQALGIKQTKLAALQAEHWISHTQVLGGIKTPGNKAQSELSQQPFAVTDLQHSSLNLKNTK